MADNCVCAQPGEYHLRSDHRHNGDDCLVAYDERCSCKKFRLGERVDVAAENARLQERVEGAERVRDGYKAESERLFGRAIRSETQAQRYKALAEQVAKNRHSSNEHEMAFENCYYPACIEARAAIEEERI